MPGDPLPSPPPSACVGISDFSVDGDLSEPTTASGLPFKRLLTVHRAALGWLPLTQQRDLSKAPTLTLSSSSIAVRALRDVLCPRPPPSLVHFDAHMHGVRLLARTQPALCDGNRSRAGCTSL